jgi:hypothetical protein
MKKLKVTEGKFSSAGNFTAKALMEKDQIFVSAAQMALLGISKIEEFKPFYLVADWKTYPVEEGSTETFDRFTALNVFKSREEMVEAFTEMATIDVDIATAIKTHATSAGLTEEQVNQLANQTW